MKGIETVKNIVYVLSAIKTIDTLSNPATTTSNTATAIPNSELPGGGTPAPKFDPGIKKTKGCNKHSKR